MKPMLHRSFKPAKCKTALQMAASRIKVLKNKKAIQIKQLRKDVSQLLESGQDQTARIRVEHVVREEKTMAAYELVGIYCELLVARLSIIETQKNCPPDLKEAVASVIFASRRCADVPELLDVLKQFSAKYGKEFANAAVELRPDCGVSRLLVEKLSAKAPDGPTKIKILNAIAEEHGIKWEPKSFGEPDPNPEDLLRGPSTFETASQMQMEPPSVLAPPVHRDPTNSNERQIAPVNFNTQYGSSLSHPQSFPYSNTDVHAPVPPDPHQPKMRPYEHGYEETELSRSASPEWKQSCDMEFPDATAAAQAAAESAEQASRAARAAAELSNQERLRRQSSTESRNSSTSCGVRSEAAQRYGVPKPQNEHIATHRPSYSYSPVQTTSRMQYEDVGYSEGGKLAGKFEKDVNKNEDESSWEGTSRVRDDMPSEDVLHVSGRHSRKNEHIAMHQPDYLYSPVQTTSKMQDEDVGNTEGCNLTGKLEKDVLNKSEDDSSREGTSRIRNNVPSADVLQMSGRHFRKSSDVGTSEGCHLAGKFEKDVENKNDDESSWEGPSRIRNDMPSGDGFQMSGRHSRKSSAETVVESSRSPRKSGDSYLNLQRNNVSSEEVQIGRQSSQASSHSYSSFRSDLNPQRVEDELNENVFAGSDKEEPKNSKAIYSPDNDDVLYDDYGFDDDVLKFDVEDEREAKDDLLILPSPGRKNPSPMFLKADDWKVGDELEKPLANQSISSSVSTWQQSPFRFVDYSKSSTAPLEVSDLAPAKFDDSNSESESEEEVFDTGSRTSKPLGSYDRDEISYMPPSFLRSQVDKCDSNLDPFKNYEKKGDRSQYYQSSRSPLAKEEEDVSTAKSDDDMEESGWPETSGSENQPTLAFGNLTGGLRNKGKRLSPYRLNPTSHTTSEVEEKDTSTKVNQLRNSRTRDQKHYSEKMEAIETIKANISAPEPSSADDDALKEEMPKKISRNKQEQYSKQRKPYSVDDDYLEKEICKQTIRSKREQYSKLRAAEENKRFESSLPSSYVSSSFDDPEEDALEQIATEEGERLSSKVPVPDFPSSIDESKDDAPRKFPNFTSRPNVGSRRTKPTPKKPEQSSLEKPKVISETVLKASMEKDILPGAPYPAEAKALFEPEARRRPLHKESHKSAVKEKLQDHMHKITASETTLKASIEKDSSPRSSYITKGERPLEPESHRQLHKESCSSAVKAKPRDSLRKIVTTSSSVESPKASSPSEETLSKGRTPSHVHPKLPDYDDLLTKLGNLRSGPW